MLRRRPKVLDMEPTPVTTNVRLGDLIAAMRTAHDDELGPRPPVAAPDRLGEVANHLIGHFVAQARRPAPPEPTSAGPGPPRAGGPLALPSKASARHPAATPRAASAASPRRPRT